MDKTILLNYKTSRKCGICKEFIFLEDYLFEKDIEILHVNSKTYHKECFREFFKGSRKYRGMDFDVFWSSVIDESTSVLFYLVVKNHLYKYWTSHYGLTLLTTSFYQKMEQIYNGKWKNISKPVLPEHLLDMFRQKQDYLDKQTNWKKITGIEALNYSIAIIANQYESYLGWLSKSKIDRIDVEKQVNDENKIDYSMFKTVKRQEKKSIFEEFDNE